LLPVFAAMVTALKTDAPSVIDSSENKTQYYEAWGQEVNGLRCMFELVPQRQCYSPGEQIGIRFWVENVSEQVIYFLTPRWLNGSDRCIVIDRCGMEQQVNSTLYLGWNPVSRIRLEPQEAVMLDSDWLGLAADSAQAQSFTHHVGHVVILAPGKYSVSFELQFHGQRHCHAGASAKGGDWEGTVITGTRQLAVKDRENGATSTPPAKAEQTPAKTAQKVSLNEPAVFAALEQVVDLDISQERTFSAVLDELTSSSKNQLNVIVFWRDLGRIGIDRDTPVQIGPIEGVPLRTALKLLLNAVAGEDDLLEYRVLDGAIRRYPDSDQDYAGQIWSGKACS